MGMQWLRRTTDDITREQGVHENKYAGLLSNAQELEAHPSSLTQKTSDTRFL